MRVLLALLAAAASACASVPKPPDAAIPPPGGADFIRVAAEPCGWACPEFDARVTPTGETQWTGRAHVALEGAHVLQLGPPLFTELRALVIDNQAHLSMGEIQPGRSTLCFFEATDMPTYDVSYALGGQAGRVSIYGGCGGDTATVILRAVARMLLALERHGAPIAPVDDDAAGG